MRIILYLMAVIALLSITGCILVPGGGGGRGGRGYEEHGDHGGGHDYHR